MCVSVGSILPVVRWEGGFAAKNARRRRGGGASRARARARTRVEKMGRSRDGDGSIVARAGIDSVAPSTRGVARPRGVPSRGPRAWRSHRRPSRPFPFASARRRRRRLSGPRARLGRSPLSRRPVSSSARRWGGRGIRGEEGGGVGETPPGGSGRDRGGRGAAEIGTRASRGARAPAWRRRFFERLARATAARRTGRAEIRRLPGAASTDARDATRVNSTGRGRSEGERATGARGMAVCVAGACAFPTARRHDF